MEERPRRRQDPRLGRLWHTARDGFRVVVGSGEDAMMEGLKLQLATRGQELDVRHQEQRGVAAISRDSYMQAMTRSHGNLAFKKRPAEDQVAEVAVTRSSSCATFAPALEAGCFEALEAPPAVAALPDAELTLPAPQYQAFGVQMPKHLLKKAEMSATPLQMQSITAVWSDKRESWALPNPNTKPIARRTLPNFLASQSRRAMVLEAMQRTSMGKTQKPGACAAAKVMQPDDEYEQDLLPGPPGKITWHSKLGPVAVQVAQHEDARHDTPTAGMEEARMTSKRSGKPEVRGLTMLSTPRASFDNGPQDSPENSQDGPVFQLRRSVDLGKMSEPLIQPAGCSSPPAKPSSLRNSLKPLQKEEPQPQGSIAVSEPRENTTVTVSTSPPAAAAAALGPVAVEVNLPQATPAGAAAAAAKTEGEKVKEEELYNHTHEVDVTSFEAEDDASHVEHVLGDTTDSLEQLRRHASFLRGHEDSTTADGSRPSTASKANQVVKRKLSLLTQLESTLASFEAVMDSMEVLVNGLLQDSKGSAERAKQQAAEARSLQKFLKQSIHKMDPRQDVAREDFQNFVRLFGLPPEHSEVLRARQALAKGLEKSGMLATQLVDQEVKRSHGKPELPDRITAVEKFLIMLGIPPEHPSVLAIAFSREALGQG